MVDTSAKLTQLSKVDSTEGRERIKVSAFLNVSHYFDYQIVATVYFHPFYQEFGEYIYLYRHYPR